MKTHDTQSVHLARPAARAFDYIADPRRLPEWAEAFIRADENSALLRTENSEVEIRLSVERSKAHGTIDWRMTFPDGSASTAYSRLVSLDSRTCVFTFVLTPPPAPLERLEGALDAQSKTLAKELARLKEIIERLD